MKYFVMVGLCLGLFDCQTAKTPPPSVESYPPGLMVIPGMVLHHEVAVKTPSRNEVVVGVMTVTGPDSYELLVQTPFGLNLVHLGRKDGQFFSELSPVLQGKFPAAKLAEDIWRIYYGRCHGPKEMSQRSCHLKNGDAVLEDWGLRGVEARIRKRTITTVPGRTIRIDYLDHQEVRPGLFHPTRIDLRSGEVSVKIALSALDWS